ncbi:MAG: UDP-N-acetylmuramate dehydrogenase [Oligoflexia bacterium]|nr:UDP-N-acetylmuramate dehydrogenase [Oligoflexia bacterium]
MLSEEGRAGLEHNDLSAVGTIPGIKLRANIRGADYSTMAVGGPLEFLAEPESAAALSGLIKRLNTAGVSYRILGLGSNVLIPDQGVPGYVIKLGAGFRMLQDLGAGLLRVGGANALMTVSRQLSEQGLCGLEFAGGIPASIGGAVRMNAGAHGHEMAELIERVEIVNQSGELLTLSAKELTFSYRYSSFAEGCVVAAVALRPVPGDAAASAKLRAEYLAERKQRQPLSVPSCGSVFKNPSREQPAGKLIEEAGLKGYQVGGARISELHANWIVNPERLASCADVQTVIDHIVKKVQAHAGIGLEPEVVRW